MPPESATNPSSPVPSVLRILHLEDSEPDRGLVRRALAGGEMACELIYAADKVEFAEALAGEKFDLVLSDFTVAGFDGMSALALAQEKCPEVPFLIVSGTIGEEQAIESLKSGATDYVRKERLERLLPAVRRALRESAERARRGLAEAALRRAEAKFRAIFEHAAAGIYQSAPDGRLLDANHAMARLSGYASPDELCLQVRDLGRDLHVNPASHAAFVRRLDECGEVLASELQIKRKDGSVIWISENARAVRGPQGELHHYDGMVTDITARKVAENSLRRSEERFREMAGRIDDVFYIAALADGHWLYVSPAYEIIWGRSLAELYLQPAQWTEAVVAEDRGRLFAAREQLAQGKEYRIEYRIRRPDGTLRWIEDRSYPLHEPAGEARIPRLADQNATNLPDQADATNRIEARSGGAAPPLLLKRAVGIATDITQRRELEGQLRQAQKMEAVGQLAGGVAHDFNNVLTVVIGYARILLDGGTLPPEEVGLVTQIFTAGTRAANLTRQLLVFSHKQTMDRQILDLNHVTDEISQMLCRVIGDHIKLVLKLSPAPCPVNADTGMIEQVIMNLAVNARDAMPNGGTLDIATEQVSLTEAAAGLHPGARPGEFICLSVRDTGCGIPLENLQRVFEPFFTTKGIGHGTGLGLAMVFGIVQQHQGWIELTSALGTGTSFRIMLPAVPVAALLPARRPAKAALASGGLETMLLVEDDPAVREYAVAVLRSHGYRVLQAGSGLDALEVWKWHCARITLLVTDLVLPGLGGVELAARLCREKPTLRVVLTSGYASETIGQEFRPPAGTHFIHKPYKPQVLAQAVRDALDNSFNR